MRAAAPTAGQLLNEQRHSQGESPTRTSPIAGEIANGNSSGSNVASGAAGGLTFTLRAIRFSGDTQLIPEGELEAFVAPAVGRTLDHAALQQLARDVTDRLRARGYMLARAYLPRQDLTHGELEIALVAGRLQSGEGRVIVTGDTRISPQRLRAIAEAALPDRVLRNPDLERAVLLVNDVPGISARSVLERGETAGTSRLVIDASEGRRLTGIIGADNFGNRSTGTVRGTAQVEMLDPLRIGDSLSLAAVGSSDTIVLGSTYSAPLTATGLRAYAALSHLRYSIRGDLEPLDLRGRATTGSLGLGYPLVRSRRQNLWINADFEQKQLTDDGLGANLRKPRINHLAVSLQGSRFDDIVGGGVLEGSLTMTTGDVDLSANLADRVADAGSARTHGSFTKVLGRLTRHQNIGQGENATWSLFASTSGQWANGNLDTSEKFILGGPNGVRAYPMGEAAGDHGVLGSVELRRDLAAGGKFKAQVLAFVDAGYVWLHDRPWTGALTNIARTNEVDLAGTGLGLNVWSGAFGFRAAYAHTLGDNPGRTVDGNNADGRSSNGRIWLQASFRF